MADEDELDDELRALDPSDPSSGPRAKSSVSLSFEVYLGEFQRRSAGLTGDELESEIARFMDRLVERHVKAVPRPLRDELRGRFRSMLANDPTMSAMLNAFRRAAAARTG